MSSKAVEELINSATKIISSNISRIKNSGGDYNTFSVLGVERDEVFTHSQIIYSFLNPKSGHYMEKKYLILFVEYVLGFTDPKDLAEEWYAEREWPFSDGRIDFVLYNDHRYIALEMKIDAIDQEAQLCRYEKYAKMQKSKYDVFYLTINGKDASPQSAEGLKKDYKRISFEKHIMEWLRNCIAITSPKNKTIHALTQYMELVEKLTFDQNKKGDTKMAEILQNAKNYRAYLELAKSEKEMKRNFLEKFFCTLSEQLQHINSGFENDAKDKLTVESNQFLNDSSCRIGFSLDTGKQLVASNGKQYNVIFRIDVGEPVGNMALGFALAASQCGKILEEKVNVKEVIATTEDEDNLNKILDCKNIAPKGTFENDWIYWDFICCSTEKSHYDLRIFNNPVIDMLDSVGFDRGINRIVTFIEGYLGRIK